MAAAQPWSRISLKSSISLSHSAANRTAVCFAATLAVALIWLSPKTAESAACVAEVDSRATNEVIIFGAVLENLPSEGEVPPLRCNGKSATGPPTLLPTASSNNDSPEESTQKTGTTVSTGDPAPLTPTPPQAPDTSIAISDTVVEESPSIPAAAAPVEEEPDVPETPEAPVLAEAPSSESDEQAPSVPEAPEQSVEDAAQEGAAEIAETDISGNGASPGDQQTAVNVHPLLTTIFFKAGSSALNAQGEARLKETALQLKANEELRVQLLAYASEDPDVPNAARRTSLSRALAVRKFLTSEGVASVRLQIRALGAKVPQGEPDRVDIHAQGG